jgi:hypothetical protein
MSITKFVRHAIMECDAISLVQGSLESNTFTRYLVQVVWPWSRTWPILVPVPWAAVCHNVQLVKLSGLCCIWFKMYDSFSTMSSSDSQKLPSFWGTIMKLPSELSGEDTVDINTVCSRVTIIQGYCQKFGPEWPTTILKACRCNSQFQ